MNPKKRNIGKISTFSIAYVNTIVCEPPSIIDRSQSLETVKQSINTQLIHLLSKYLFLVHQQMPELISNQILRIPWLFHFLNIRLKSKAASCGISPGDKST